MGIARVVLETDALTVKNALEGDDYRLSTLGGLIAETKHLMASEFVSCKVRFCPRVCNRIAHELASVVNCLVALKLSRRMYFFLRS
jgi:hypothetical protein